MENPPRYTIHWLCVQSVAAFVISGILTLFSFGINSLAHTRLNSELLTHRAFDHFSDSLTFCFFLLIISLFSIMFVELNFRKRVNLLQYSLIGCGLLLSFLLMLSFTEFIPFWAAYMIAMAMTIALIAVFVKAIFERVKAASMITSILLVEYALMFALVYIGSAALLVGSISLFIILAVAMYFTIKLKVVDDEISFKQ